MQEIILNYGPPPLTQQAADAALDVIDFIAAAVRGYDAIDVTNVVRPLWRTQLAAWYPHLPFEARHWYANAPLTLATFLAQWPLLDPVQRDMILRQWSFELPHMLMLLDPVLEEAHAIETREHVRAGIAATRQHATSGTARTGGLRKQRRECAIEEPGYGCEFAAAQCPDGRPDHGAHAGDEPQVGAAPWLLEVSVPAISHAGCISDYRSGGGLSTGRRSPSGIADRVLPASCSTAGQRRQARVAPAVS